MRKLELTAEGVTVWLTIRHATVSDAMRRGMLAAKAAETNYLSDVEQVVAVMVLPALHRLHARRNRAKR